ncbi:MAG: magnesium transporter [Nitrospirales bacterium]
MKPRQLLHDVFFREYPEEAAHILESFPVVEIVRILEGTSGENAASLLSAMVPSVAADVLCALPDRNVRQVVPRLSPPVASILLRQMDGDMRDALLSKVSPAVAEDISTFLDYPPESVGSLMDPHVLALPQDLTVEEAIAQLRARAPQDAYDLYVIDRQHLLVGMLSLRDLLLVPPNERLRAIMRPDLPSIHPMENRDRIVELFEEQRLFTIPVVDLDGRLLGVIRNEDIFRAGQEEATADLQTMVGASKDERPLSPVWFSVRKRLPWLQVNLVTAFLAASVVALFEDTIARFTALAVLMPVVAGESGNTGQQSLAVVMRGLALRDVRPRHWLAVGTKQLSVSFLNGVLISTTSAAAVFLWSHSVGLAFIIGTSMLASMCIAGLAGAIIPVGLSAMKQDPAQSSSIVLTTVTDVTGFLSFLGLATMFVGLLE